MKNKKKTIKQSNKRNQEGGGADPVTFTTVFLYMGAAEIIRKFGSSVFQAIRKGLYSAENSKVLYDEIEKEYLDISELINVNLNLSKDLIDIYKNEVEKNKSFELMKNDNKPSQDKKIDSDIVSLTKENINLRLQGADIYRMKLENIRDTIYNEIDNNRKNFEKINNLTIIQNNMTQLYSRMIVILEKRGINVKDDPKAIKILTDDTIIKGILNKIKEKGLFDTIPKSVIKEDEHSKITEKNIENLDEINKIIIFEMEKHFFEKYNMNEEEGEEDYKSKYFDCIQKLEDIETLKEKYEIKMKKKEMKLKEQYENKMKKMEKELD